MEGGGGGQSDICSLVSGSLQEETEVLGSDIWAVEVTKKVSPCCLSLLQAQLLGSPWPKAKAVTSCWTVISSQAWTLDGQDSEDFPMAQWKKGCAGG